MVERHHFRCRAWLSASGVGEELTYIFRLGYNDRSFRLPHSYESRYDSYRIAIAWNMKLNPTLDLNSFYRALF